MADESTGTSALTAPPAGDPPPAPPAALPAGDPPPVGDPPKSGEPPPKPGDPPKDPPAAFAADKLTLPEGMKADDPMLTDFGNILGNDKLDPQARGQALLDLHAEALKQAREAGTEAWNNLQKDWQTKAMADPDVGGAKFPATKATVAKAIDTLPADLAADFRQALNVTGAGNHPAIIKALHSWATKLTEGGHVTGAPAGAKTPTIAEAFYPNSNMK